MGKNDVQVDATALYLPAGGFLLRTPALPARTFHQLATAHTEEDAPVLNLETVLQRQRSSTLQTVSALSARPQVELAIAIASFSLHQGLLQWRQGALRPRRINKTAAGLLRYLIRMSTRPTPFGLFSGVGLGFFGQRTTLELGAPAIERMRSRPDMTWLLAVLKELEASPGRVQQLAVHTNQLAYLAGGRVLLPHTDTYGQQQHQAVSLRATPVVRKALELAHEPLTYPALREALLQAFPRATVEQVERLLWQMYEHGLLVSQLHPPLTTAHPASYLYEQLETLQGAEAIRACLGGVLATAAALDAAGIDARLEMLPHLVRLQNTLVSDQTPQPPIQVDSTLCMHSPTLHRGIGDAGARIAEILLRLTPFPEGSPSLKQYRARFLETYGAGAEVPLLELLSPERGLDAPAGYTQPPPAFQEQLSQRPRHETRERALHALVQEALNSQRLEVELTDAQLAALETWHPRLGEAPRSLEIYLQVQAASRQAIDRGEFCAVVSPNTGSQGAGRSFGRFVDVLGEKGTRALEEWLSREEATQPEAIFAELSYQAPSGRTSNVAICPLLRKYEIAVGTTPSAPPERVIRLDDLVVGVSGDRWYLRSQRFNKRVVVCHLHMLNSALAPNACRFIAEIASDGLPALSGFDWGSLSAAPFLPRLTVAHGPRGRLVLTPACWNLQTGTFQPQGEGSEEAGRFAGLQHWRAHWRVPRYAYLTQADQRLLLDLEHPLMAAELFQALDALKEGQWVVLQELLPDFEHLWLTDTQGAPYFAEFVVPLLRRDGLQTREPDATLRASSALLPRASSRSKAISSHAHVVSREVRVYYPGDAWNYVKLYCTTAQQEELIAGPLRELVSGLGAESLIDRWFFLRYADPQPHLRVRIHSSSNEQIRPALDRLLTWSRELAARGLIQRYSLETYEREVARYGGPLAIDLLEQVMCLDSELCSQLVTAHYTHRLMLDLLAVAVFSLDRLFACWGYDRDQRLQWLKPRTENDSWSAEFRRVRPRYCELLAPRETHADPELDGELHLLREAVAPLEGQLPPLAAQVRTLAQAGQLWVAEDELLASVAHLHKIRLLGLEETLEQKMYAFWRRTGESIRLRPV